MMGIKKSLFFIIITYCLIMIVKVPSYHCVGSIIDIENAKSAIKLADESIKIAYNAVYEAEREGSDITELVRRLNNALDTLSENVNVFKSGEYDDLMIQTEYIIENSEEITNDMIWLKTIAEINRKIAFKNRLVISIGLFATVLILSYFSWLLFKRIYVRSIMGLKPEVLIDES